MSAQVPEELLQGGFTPWLLTLPDGELKGLCSPARHTQFLKLLGRANRASCVLLVPCRPYGPIQGGVFRTERCPQWLLRLFRLFARCSPHLVAHSPPMNWPTFST